MASLNRVFLMGNLTRDPELRYTPSGTPVCEFGMAINRTYTTGDGQQRDEACFVDITMWGRRGVAISEYFTKGKPIFIEGRLKYDTWETAEGRRSKMTVVAENFEFIGGRSGAPEGEERPRERRPAGGDDRAPDRREGQASDRREERAPDRRQGRPEPSKDASEGTDVADDEIPF